MELKLFHFMQKIFCVCRTSKSNNKHKYSVDPFDVVVFTHERKSITLINILLLAHNNKAIIYCQTYFGKKEMSCLHASNTKITHIYDSKIYIDIH